MIDTSNFRPDLLTIDELQAALRQAKTFPIGLAQRWVAKYTGVVHTDGCPEFG